MKIIILAGGKGTRLWPLSRKNLPKQFLRLGGEKSLFQRTLERALVAARPEDVFISTGQSNVLNVKRDLRETSVPAENIILRPEGQDTAASVYTSISAILDRGGNVEDIAAVMPSDHLIEPVRSFADDLEKAGALAKKGHIVLIGIRPSAPETVYGYIRPGKPIGGAFRVDKFVEKPDAQKAAEYIREGYLWNAGIAVFPLGLMREEFQNNAPDIISDVLDEARTSSVSLDTGVLEKSGRLAIIPASFSWSDVGSWSSIQAMETKDPNGNSAKGNVVTHNTKNSLILGGKKMIAVAGMEDILVVDSDDAIFVAPLKDAHMVKSIIQKLESEKRKEVLSTRPMVSIITTVFSYREFLPQAVRSVLAQTYPNLEYIILDTGTPEWNADLRREIANFGAHEKNVHIIFEPGTWRGIYDALNRGIAAATGDIIGILHADDFYMDEHAVEAMVSAMSETGADIGWGDLLYVKRDNAEEVTRVWKSSGFYPGKFKSGWHPAHPTLFVRREVYEKFGNFRKDMPIAADYELMLRFLEKLRLPGCYVSRFMVKMREGGNSNWKNLWKVLRGNLESYRAFKLNGLRVSPWFIIRKPLSKIIQLFQK